MKSDQTFWSILDAVLYLEIRKGHLKWTVSDLSRTSGITRSLIYYYFGKKKEEILSLALKMFGEEFFGLSNERAQEWKAGKIGDSIRNSRGLMQKAPHLGVFYLLWRQKESEVQKQIIELENRYLQKIKSSFPHLSDEKVRGLFAVFLGFVIAPFIQDDDIEIPLSIARSIIGDVSSEN